MKWEHLKNVRSSTQAPENRISPKMVTWKQNAVPMVECHDH
ncbi:hypothetical protein RISK_004050 [Rhodopirellula islandica]|uniref:Uncharacterized protein n=1 Tax=Rhodopirellula islandica TaxID=595434 RepID=A0A0J1BAU0_RHOIS|nr:hypothetical protein RISK_004050 [Rhodopirellula islandica]